MPITSKSNIIHNLSTFWKTNPQFIQSSHACHYISKPRPQKRLKKRLQQSLRLATNDLLSSLRLINQSLPTNLVPGEVAVHSREYDQSIDRPTTHLVPSDGTVPPVSTTNRSIDRLGEVDVHSREYDWLIGRMIGAHHLTTHQVKSLCTHVSTANQSTDHLSRTIWGRSAFTWVTAIERPTAHFVPGEVAVHSREQG